MPYTPSNLYAEEVFSHNPTALWALDEQADFVSLIEESTRDLSIWDYAYGSAEPSFENVLQAFPNSYTTKLTGIFGEGKIEGKSLATFSSSSTSFAINIGIFTQTERTVSVELGYKIGSSTPVTKTFSISPMISNILSATFEDVVENANIFIRISFGPGTSPLEYYANGLSIGHRSEQFCNQSLGIYTIPRSSINIPTEYFTSNAIEARQYGTIGESAFYASDGERVFATNQGVPMVFGASSSTAIVQAYGNHPSLIVPGHGFLNEVGQKYNLTLEMWMRFNTSGISPEFRVVGPVASQDGIYIGSSHMLLRIGNKVAAAYISEWSRPMLVQVKKTSNSAILSINGEDLATIDLEDSDQIFPEQFLDGKSLDWIGFYNNSPIDTIELDCIAIYPNISSTNATKIRYTKGQAVTYPENLNTLYGGSSVLIDYSFSKYAKNINYQNIRKFTSDGYPKNLSTKNNILSFPDYKLPEVIIESDTKTYSDWLNDNYLWNLEFGGSPVIKVKTGTEYPNIYIKYDSINNVLQEAYPKAIMGRFERAYIASEEVWEKLFTLQSKLTNKKLYVIAKAPTGGGSAEVQYRYFDGTSDTLIHSQTQSQSDINAGIDFAKMAITLNMSSDLYLGLGEFSVYVGGEPNSSESFSGEIESFSFLGEYAYSRLNSYDFNSNGTAAINSPSATITDGYVSDYSLVMKDLFSNFRLDIAAKSSWHDFIPLSSLQKDVVQQDGTTISDIDFIQLNISAGQRDRNVRAEVTLVDSTDLDRPLSYYGYTGLLTYPNNNLLVSGTSGEFIDGSVMYIPDDIDWKNTLVKIAIGFNTDGLLTRPVSLKKLEVASQVMEKTRESAIGTRFGIDLRPYYYDISGNRQYGEKNPISIYKGSTPHLYLTNSSGIRLAGTISVENKRGIAIPINIRKNPTYYISSAQLAVRYSESSYFPETPMPILEIDGKTEKIKIYMSPIDSYRDRATLTAVQVITDYSTGVPIESEVPYPIQKLSFYVNGIYATKPVVLSKMWTFISIGFETALDMSSYTGGINLIGPLMYNNISFHQLDASTAQIVGVRKTWGDILVDSLWSDYLTTLWTDTDTQQVVGARGVSQVDSYNTYVGTNKLIVDSAEEGQRLLTDNYQYIALTDVQRKTYVVDPV